MQPCNRQAKCEILHFAAGRIHLMHTNHFLDPGLVPRGGPAGQVGLATAFMLNFKLWPPLINKLQLWPLNSTALLSALFRSMFWQIKLMALDNKIFYESTVIKGSLFVHESVLNQDKAVIHFTVFPFYTSSNSFLQRNYYT